MYDIKHIELIFYIYSRNRKPALLCYNKLTSSVDIISGVLQGSMLGPYLFLLFINANCYIKFYDRRLNVIGMTPWSMSQMRVSLKYNRNCKIYIYLNKVSNWYRENCLRINCNKSQVIHVGGNAQLKSLSGNEFILKYEDTPLALVENVEYLDMSINSDISWDLRALLVIFNAWS